MFFFLQPCLSGQLLAVFSFYRLHLSFKLAIALPTLFKGTVSQEFRTISCCHRDNVSQGLHLLSGENCKPPLNKFFFLLILPISSVGDPDPDPLIRGTDPRIRICTKMSRIPNTAYKQRRRSKAAEIRKSLDFWTQICTAFLKK
jgi:hypothetical protein